MRLTKILSSLFISALALIPLATGAAVSVPWVATSTSQGWISPTRINGTEQTPFAQNFIASSTSLVSFFPLLNFTSATGTSATTTSLFSTTASTTNLSGTNISGFGLVSCSGASSALTYSGTLFGCHTISASGGSGTVSTSSAETSGRIPFWTTTSATPALLSGGVSGFAFDSSLTKLTVTNASTTDISISSLGASRIPYSASGGHLLTTSGLQFNDTTNLLTVTNASTTALASFGSIGQSFFDATGMLTLGTNSALGTPASITLTNGTGLPISSGVSGLGTGVATFLGTPSSANLASAITDETGSGLAVFGTSPTFTTGLTVTDSVTGVTPVITLNNSGSFAASEPALDFKNNSGTVITTSRISSLGGTSFTNSILKFSVANSSKTLTERMRIDVNGNVGIGTTTPTSRLDVVGTLGNTGNLFRVASTTATNVTSDYLTVGASGTVSLPALTSNGFVKTSGGTGALSIDTSTYLTSAVTSVGLSSTNSTLTIGATPVTTTGTITADLNLAHANTWSGGQTFGNTTTTNATTTTASFTTASTTNLTVSSLGTAAGTFVAANASGQLIATTTPTTTIGSTLISYPRPITPGTYAFANGGYNSNTTLYVGQVFVPAPITFNHVSFIDNGITTPGSVKVAIFSSDGKTQYFSTTTVVTTGGVLHTATTTSPVTLPQGIYYFATLPISTTNVVLSSYSTQANSILGLQLSASDPIPEGTLTVTANTLPATITPSSIVMSGTTIPIFRLDN